MAQLIHCMAYNKMWTPTLSNNNKPLYLQIVDAIALAIVNGELIEGERLPPQRQLAWRLEINPSTVSKGFQEATKRHLICGEVGRGSYVLAKSSEATLFDLSNTSDSRLIDLSTHVPAIQPNDQDLQTTLTEIVNHSLSDLNQSTQLLSYLSPETLQRLKLACAEWLFEFGYSIAAENCIPTTCAQNALTVALLASSQNNDTILVDELTFPGIKAVAKQLRLKLHGVEMDEQGIIPAALERALNSCDAKVLVSDPTLQNPTGAIMGETRRKVLADIIKRKNILFIEEYVIGALSGIPPISCNLQHHSILITSFAKSVSPGIRFAVLAGKHPLIETINQQSYSTSWQLSPLMAEIARQWIKNGTVKTRTAWQWQEIKRRFRLAKSVLRSNSSCPQFSREIASSHLWLPVNEAANEAAEKCLANGVRVVPSSSFAVSYRYPDCIRVSLTAAKTIRELKIGLNGILKAGVLI